MSQRKKGAFTSGSKAERGVRALEMAGPSSGQAVHEIALARIDPDPQNPRRLSVDPTTETLASLGADDKPEEDAGEGGRTPEARRKIVELRELLELADSIRQSGGILQPIHCYRHGDRYRICYGERRYWGAFLAGYETIPVLVLSEPPQHLRRNQVIENIQREALNARDMLVATEAVIRESKSVDENPIDSGADLARSLGVDRRHGERIWGVRESTEVREAVEDGVLPSLSAAFFVIQHFKTPAERAAAVSHVRRKGSLPKPPNKHAAGKPVKGRPKQAANLGKVADLATLEAIVTAVAERAGCEDLLEEVGDWSDYAAVEQLWKVLMGEIAAS